VLAFHEAFADIVALFQHFSMPEALLHQIVAIRGDFMKRSLLSELAVEFGMATECYGALRDAIGKIENPHDPDPSKRRWAPSYPSPSDYRSSHEPHDLGSVLVAAVFDAFLKIYNTRTADLVRLATGGSGILPEGAISMDLANRLAQEAGKVATHVLRICIRALDYCPPFDITFGEYLRALITADHDLVPSDPLGYRVAFVSAFRDRGIYPADVKHLSVGSLAWEPPPLPLENVEDILKEMSLDWNLTTDRRAAYGGSRRNAVKFHAWLTGPKVSDEELDSLGFVRSQQPMKIGKVAGELHGLEVHSVRPARRIGPDGQSQSDLVVEITQTFYPTERRLGRFRGGCTLLIDLEKKRVRYLIRKKVHNPERLEAQLQFTSADYDDLRANYFDQSHAVAEPFAMLHRPLPRRPAYADG
jgi:hypothetical protein